MRFLTLFLLFATLAPVGARAETVVGPDHLMQWRLSVDGEPIGSRELRIRYAATGDMRMIEGYTEVRGRKLAGPVRRVDYRQRLTANSNPLTPASFHSVLERDGAPLELQARMSHGKWKVTTVHPEGTRTHTLHPRRIDLSTVDLFDPGCRNGLAGLEHARILTAETGKIEEGPVRHLGVSSLVVGGERIEVEGYEWTTSVGTWRFFYATNGYLVRYHAPLAGVQVEAELMGPAPRSVDEFPVAWESPPVEVIDL